MNSRTQPETQDKSGPEAAEPGPARSALRRLSGDRVLWLALAALVIIPIPSFFLSLTEDQLWWWDSILVNLILYSLAGAAVLVGIRRIQSPAERRFWRSLSLAIGSLIAVYLFWAISELFVPFVTESVSIELFSQAGYLAFYVFFALALDSNRAGREGPVGQELQWIRAAGLGVLLAGFLAYFAVVPALIYWEDPLAWVPILLVYASLDLLLCLQALRVKATVEDRRWKGLFGWFALVLASFALVDFLEAADYAGWIDVERLGVVLELQWYVPISLLILGARYFHTQEPAEREDPSGQPVLLKGGPLLVYAAGLPLIHFLFYGLDLLDPELHGLREVVALAGLLLVGILAFIYQRKVEVLNRAAHQELRGSQSKYSTFVETSVEGIFLLRFEPPLDVTDPPRVQMAEVFRHATIVETNHAMAGMYGFESPESMVGLVLGDLFQRVKRSRRNAAAAWNFVSGGYRAIRETLEYLDAEGNRRYFEGSIVGTVENDNVVQAWCTQVDVTARFEAQEEKEALEEQLRRSQRLETIGTLAGGIAHDFNNILTPVLGYTELVAESIPSENSEAQTNLSQIRNAAIRAKELIGQILTVGQRRRSEFQTVEVRPIVEEALQLLRNSVPSTIRFETHFTSGLDPVAADPGQIHQIVMNLCTNAYQAMEGSRGTIRIRLAPETLDEGSTDWDLEPGEYVSLTVSDDGPGMPPAVVDRAFEPFYTTKEVGKGTGLGLSVTHGIVKSHGGEIGLRTEEGVGTVITILLPTTDLPIASEAQTPKAVHPKAPAAMVPVDKIPVILVDDEEKVAQTCRAMLRRMGFLVETFTDSRQALERLESGPNDFHVLVTDYTMPDLIGTELAEAALTLNPELGVVIASGHRLEDKGDLEGSAAYLEKPYTFPELRAALDQVLGSEKASG